MKACPGAAGRIGALPSNTSSQLREQALAISWHRTFAFGQRTEGTFPMPILQWNLTINWHPGKWHQLRSSERPGRLLRPTLYKWRVSPCIHGGRVENRTLHRGKMPSSALTDPDACSCCVCNPYFFLIEGSLTSPHRPASVVALGTFCRQTHTHLPQCIPGQ